MKNEISNYLESKSNAWSRTTMSSEEYRLNAVKDHLDGDPEALWAAIQDRAPYTRQTIWVRVCDFFDWAMENSKLPMGANPYRVWRKKNAKVFKNVYQPRTPSISFEDVRARLEKIQNLAIRRRALEILGSGTRWMESEQSGDVVRGKGGLSRRVFRPEVSGPDFKYTYETFRRELAKVGLKPHTLRKLCATQLARNGMNESDLCKAMGWQSFTTARCYIAPVNEDKMATHFETLQKRKVG